MKSLLKSLLEIFYTANAQRENELLLAKGGTEFQFVSIVRKHRTASALHMTIIFNAWILIFCGGFIVLLVAIGYDFPFNILLEYGGFLLIVFLFFSGIVYMSASLNDPNMTYSGLGTRYDNRHRKLTNYGLIVDDKGIHGFLEKKWSTFDSASLNEPDSVTLVNKLHGKFLRSLAAKEITLKFANPEDATNFLSIAISAIQK